MVKPVKFHYDPCKPVNLHNWNRARPIESLMPNALVARRLNMSRPEPCGTIRPWIGMISMWWAIGRGLGLGCWEPLGSLHQFIFCCVLTSALPPEVHSAVRPVPAPASLIILRSWTGLSTTIGHRVWQLWICAVQARHSESSWPFQPISVWIIGKMA